MRGVLYFSRESEGRENAERNGREIGVGEFWVEIKLSVRTFADLSLDRYADDLLR